MTGKNGTEAAPASTGGSLISDEKLRQLYTTMVRCRLLAEFAAGVRPKAKQASLYAVAMGQEAIAAGWVIDLLPNDAVAPAAGDPLPSLVKGATLAELMAQIYPAPNAGSDAALGGVDGQHNILPPSLPPAEHWRGVLAMGTACKRKKGRSVVVAFASHLTTEDVDWRFAVFTAATKKLPILFVVENNPWADPASAASQDGEHDFTRKARGYGLPGISVDGNDVVAVYRVACESLTRVREGDGPVMVEARPFHVSGKKKRSLERDPLVHMEGYLRAKRLYEPEQREQLTKAFTAELKQAARAARRA